MHNCADCGAGACAKADRAAMPKNCPMQDDTLNSIAPEYLEPGEKDFFIASAEIEAAGYGVWPRLKETAEFCRRLGYTRVGLAFCLGLKREAKIIAGVLRSYDIEPVSISCKVGAIPKRAAGITAFVRSGDFESMCNPIVQAKLLNAADTQFNIVVGLCVGHDSLFYKYSAAPVTTLIAKDRALAHNPVGAVYCAEGYFRNRLRPGETSAR